MRAWQRLLTLLCLLIWLSPAAAGTPDFSPAGLTTALAAAQNRPVMGHPRLFKGQADFAGIVAAASNERILGRKALEGYLHRVSVRSSDTSFLTIASGTASVASLNNWFRQERVLEGMAESAFAWYLTRDTWYLDELATRVAIFYPQIMGSQCRGEPTQTRAYAWYFALAYDLAFPALSQQQRSAFRDVVKTCVDSSLNSIIADVVANPRNGIAFHALGKFVGALLIVSGDIPEAQQWLKRAVLAYVPNLSPWGGSDGGYANGTSYLLWDAGESLLIWDLLDRVAGVPIYQKQWLAELPRFVAYTLPPGTPSGVFGDGAEMARKEEWARFGKAIMSRYEMPLARWYEKQLFGDDPSRLTTLLSPQPPALPAYWPTGEPDSRLFPSVGWVAMHSAMADRSRISVYFKSSPFGSMNHSHADQNSFVLFAHGQVLAMDSGYYDYYNSPHWHNWYKQTRAHNAITFDDGKGQGLGVDGLGSEKYHGRITQFVTNSEYDFATGDAVLAYGDQLTLAKRSVYFHKPATLIVVDQLGADKPRKWEWNLHTLAPLSENAGSYRLSVADAEMCVDVSAPQRLSLKTDSGYAPAPQISGPIAPHFWSKFSYAIPNEYGLFVSVLKMDCSLPDPVVEFSRNGAAIKVGRKTIQVGASDVLVQ